MNVKKALRPKNLDLRPTTAARKGTGSTVAAVAAATVTVVMES